jgi:TPR repeat protein
MVQLVHANPEQSQFRSRLIVGLLTCLAGCAFSAMAQAQSAAIATKLLPFGKSFALHVMEHVAAAGVVEGVTAIVTPTKPTTPPPPDKPPAGNNTTLFAPSTNTTNIFITSPTAQPGCVQGTCVGTNFLKLYSSPKTPEPSDLSRKWNPKSGCDRSTDPTQLLGRAVNLENGIGVPARDPTGAVACYELAAQAGIPLAQFRLADIYATGDEAVPPNPNRSRFWLQEAAARGFPQAQTQLAFDLEDEGNGLMAFYWYQSAAAAGEPFALFELSRIYHSGEYGVPMSWHAAYSYLYLSLQLGAFDNPEFVMERQQAMQGFFFTEILRDAQNGVAEAQLMAANAYESGIPLVLPQNRPLGLCWADRAAAQMPNVRARINQICNNDYPRSCPVQPARC